MVCMICREDETRPVATPCGHIFCAECIHEWLRWKLCCPTCRSVATPTTLLRVYPEVADPKASPPPPPPPPLPPSVPNVHTVFSLPAPPAPAPLQTQQLCKAAAFAVALIFISPTLFAWFCVTLLVEPLAPPPALESALRLIRAHAPSLRVVLVALWFSRLVFIPLLIAIPAVVLAWLSLQDAVDELRRAIMVIFTRETARKTALVVSLFAANITIFAAVLAVTGPVE